MEKTVPEVLSMARGRRLRAVRKTIVSNYDKTEGTVFPIWTDLGRRITCLFFSSDVEYFLSSFCVEFSLQPFSNLVYLCVLRLGNRK